ncbi:MAG: hypothetical protein IJJ26_10275 [Victivallales bacterium]|nr:hypothetical protein [Victivallales bacterium]
MGRFAKTEQYTPEENAFWEQFCACAGRDFRTMRGLPFTFEVRGNEVFFDRKAKSITRATIIRGYQTARALVASNTPFSTPKQLGVFGASYLCPVLQFLGIIP